MAVTLAFAEVGELVVALGEVVDGSPSYLPDSLIVTGSRDAALSYRPSAALTPAWTSNPAIPDVETGNRHQRWLSRSREHARRAGSGGVRVKRLLAALVVVRHEGLEPPTR